eukprot:5511144-Amphidinium_carterae.1
MSLAGYGRYAASTRMLSREANCPTFLSFSDTGQVCTRTKTLLIHHGYFPTCLIARGLEEHMFQLLIRSAPLQRAPLEVLRRSGTKQEWHLGSHFG